MISYDICISLSDKSLSMIISRSIHVAANGIISLFYDQGSIPLYICTTVSLSMHCANEHLVASMLEYIKNTYIKDQDRFFSGHITNKYIYIKHLKRSCIRKGE